MSMPPSPPPPSPIHTPWTNTQFDVSMAFILLLLLVATILTFAIQALLRFLLRLYRRHLPTTSTPKRQNPNIVVDSLPPALVFTSTTSKLAGGAECAICLSEFVDGERVRVMPACNHGFHVKCVEGWLAAKASCPTCRTSCLPVADV